jgi:phage gpG-like protein
VLTIRLSDIEALDTRLAALPAELKADLMAKIASLASALAEKIRSEKLSGQVLNAVSGALRDSIGSETSFEGDSIVASLGSDGAVKYAAIHEYGGKTAAHEILPSKANVLTFVAGGAMRFARRVEHPGSLIPERSYLRSSLAEMTDEILAALAASPDEVWERL